MKYTPNPAPWRRNENLRALKFGPKNYELAALGFSVMILQHWLLSHDLSAWRYQNIVKK